MGTAVVAGTLCLDLVPRLPLDIGIEPGRLFDAGPLGLRAGGCVANTGGDLVDLGATVRAVGVVGDDDLGVVLRSRLRARGLDDAGVVVEPSATTSYSIVVEPPGIDRTFWHHVGANASFDASLVENIGADIVHIGYPPLLPGLVADDGAALAAAFAETRRAGVVTSLDLAAVRPETSGVDWARFLRVVLPQTDLLTPSDDDLSGLLRRPVPRSPDSLIAIADELIALGAAVVMITAGSDGAVLRAADARRLDGAGDALARLSGRWSAATYRAAATGGPAVSTVGAGDAATAGFLSAILGRLDPPMALDLAMWAAAQRVSGGGRLPPLTSWAFGQFPLVDRDEAEADAGCAEDTRPT